MTTTSSSCWNNSRALVEMLERRELLSASAAPLGGTYAGNLHLNGGRAALDGGPARRAISITFSSSGEVGPLSGTVSVDGLGNLPFTGAADGTHVTLLLSGSTNSSGVITGTLKQHGHLFAGQFAENTAGHSLAGSLTARSGGSALSVGASNLPAAPGARVSRPALGGTYTGTGTVGTNNAKAALIITSETSDGQVSGSVAIGSQTFAMIASFVGSRLEFLLSGSAIADGSLTISPDTHTLQGTFAEQTRSGIVQSQFAVSNAATTTSTLTTGTAATSPGSTVGLSSGASGIGGFTGGLTSPISGIGAPVSGTSAAGTILGSPVNGGATTPITGIMSSPVTGNISPPPTGNVSTPVTGATTPPATGNVSPPVTGTVNGGASTSLTGGMVGFPGEPGFIF